MSEEERRHSFVHHRWAEGGHRGGGPLANFLLAIVIFSGL